MKDEYGRQIGKVISFAVNPDGRIDSLFIEHGDGELLRYSYDQFRSDGSSVVLQSPLKRRIKRLCDGIPLIWRKEQALNDLIEKKKIPQEMGADFHKSFEGALNQLRSEAQGVIKQVEEKIWKSTQQVTELHSALINLEIERQIGKIDQKTYETALLMIQEGLKHTNNKKKDLELMKTQLSNVTLGESSKIESSKTDEPLASEVKENQEASASASSTLPEPPVVVYVKNIDKEAKTQSSV